jgi:tRNA(Ile)-lysidine synthase
MLKEMLATIERNGLISPGDVVLVAISGGPDSVALLEGLLRVRKRLSFSVCAAHLNHRLRGAEGDEDERFVRNLAQKWGLPLIAEARHVKRIQQRRGGSIEEVAREVRYAFLRKAARKCRATKIALGHNLDDNVETFLMNLIRGSGLKGLSGIPLSRKEGRFVIIRPLLGITRGEILSFLKREKLEYREDRSNLDTTFTRNRVRHQLLPQFEREYNPRIKKVLVETARRLQEAEECICAVMTEMEKDCLDAGRGRIAVNIPRLRSHGAALGREFLRRELEGRLGLTGEQQKLEQVWQLVTGARSEGVGLGKGLFAWREYDELLLVEEPKLRAAPFEKKLRIPCDVFLAELGLQISAKYVARRDVRIRRGRPLRFGEVWRKVQQGHAQSFEEYFDAHAVQGDSLIVRTRREGDALRPLGMRGKRKVKQLLIDEKVPLTLRDRIPVFEAGGRVLWIVGYRPAAESAVKESSEKLLRLRAKVLYCPEQDLPL